QLALQVVQHVCDERDIVGLVSGQKRSKAAGIPRLKQARTGAVWIYNDEARLLCLLVEPAKPFHDLRRHGRAVQGDHHRRWSRRIVLGRNVDPVIALIILQVHGAIVVARSQGTRRNESHRQQRERTCRHWSNPYFIVAAASSRHCPYYVTTNTAGGSRRRE